MIYSGGNHILRRFQKYLINQETHLGLGSLKHDRSGTSSVILIVGERLTFFVIVVVRFNFKWDVAEWIW